MAAIPVSYAGLIALTLLGGPQAVDGERTGSLRGVEPPPVCTGVDQTLPLNTQYAACAWAALSAENYREVLNVTSQCLDMFELQAVRDQEALTRDEVVTLPPSVKPDSATKASILARGVLNDVAACAFIRGQAQEKLGQSAEAIVAYQTVRRFPDARIWDARTERFWSPAVAAGDRIERLRS